MDFLKSQIARIQLQLNGLSASQKMLTATLVTIMVMTLLWWGRYAGTAEMEPVLDQAFSSEDISRITMQLAARGIQYKVAGDKVLVPSDRKIEVLADLGYQQLLPRDTKNGFDEIVKQMSPWNSVDTNKQMWNRAKEMTLSQVIRNFPNVSNAAVIIDPTADRRIGTDLQPSATIDIQMRNNDKPAKKLVEAAADVVAGAQSGLARSRVKVIVNGASYSIHDKDADGSFESSDLIELVQQNERRFADKISSQLAFIQGVMVSVTVDVNTKSERRVEHTVDPKGISKVAEEENQTEESTSPVPSAGSNDPGAGANTGATVGAGNAAATPANTTTTEKNRTQYYNVYGHAEAQITAPAGVATVVAASVRVPLSYFSNIYKMRNPSAKEPNEKMLQPLVDAELPNIRNDVKACTGLKADDAVSVQTYVDLMPQVASAPPIAMTGTMTGLLGNHVKEIAVVALAIMSLFMVSMMVRKSSPSPALVSSQPIESAHLMAREELAGEAGEGSSMLDGIELDEDAVRAQQMLSQVTNMVDENPDAAATLVKRWLNRA